MTALKESRLRIVDMAGLLAAPPRPRDEVVPGFAEQGRVTMLVSEPDLGKSLIAQAIAGRVAAGASVGGRECAQGRVAYVDAENGAELFAERLRLFGDVANADDIVYVDALSEGFDLASPAGFDDLGRTLAEIGPTLVVLDTQSSLWLGDPNDGRSTAELLKGLRRLARELYAAFVVLGHVTKSRGIYLGHTNLKGGADYMFKLDRSRRSGGDIITITAEKFRRAARPEPWRLRFIETTSGLRFEPAPRETEPSVDAGDGKLSASERIADQIRAALEDGSIEPGEALSMSAVARRIDVSKGAAVTQALEALAVGGIVDRADGTWTFAPLDSEPPTDDSSEDWDDEPTECEEATPTAAEEAAKFAGWSEIPFAGASTNGAAPKLARSGDDVPYADSGTAGRRYVSTDQIDFR